MLVPGDQWPVFIYAGFEYDEENPWKGLFKSSILVSVSWFTDHPSQMHIKCWVGLQTCIHFSQLSGEDHQGDTFRECYNSWHDMRYFSIHCLHCYSGTWFTLFIVFNSAHCFIRHDLLSALHRFSPELIQPQIRKDFTPVFWSGLTTPMSRRKFGPFSYGGIGATSFYGFWAEAHQWPLINRIIFPSYSSAQRLPTKNGALAKMREKRALRKAASTNSQEDSGPHAHV